VPRTVDAERYQAVVTDKSGQHYLIFDPPALTATENYRCLESFILVLFVPQGPDRGYSGFTGRVVLGFLAFRPRAVVHSVECSSRTVECQYAYWRAANPCLSASTHRLWVCGDTASRSLCPSASNRSETGKPHLGRFIGALDASVQPRPSTWSSLGTHREAKSASRRDECTHQDSIPYFADKKTRSFGGAACATSCQVDILSSVRSAIGFTHFMTAYQASARSGRRASIRTQNEHCRAQAASTFRRSW